MANTDAGEARTIDRITFWILVHGATAALWEDCEANGGIPTENRIQTAYEALGILHAQAHAELEQHGGLAYLKQCPMAWENTAAAQIVVAPHHEQP